MLQAREMLSRPAGTRPVSASSPPQCCPGGGCLSSSVGPVLASSRPMLLVCLLTCLLCLLACFHACPPACLLACFACSLACVLACLLARPLPCFLACLIACLLACLLACCCCCSPSISVRVTLEIILVEPLEFLSKSLSEGLCSLPRPPLEQEN